MMPPVLWTCDPRLRVAPSLKLCAEFLLVVGQDCKIAAVRVEPLGPDHGSVLRPQATALASCRSLAARLASKVVPYLTVS